MNEKIINPELKKYYKYTRKVSNCIYPRSTCCKERICSFPKSCCRIWTNKNISQHHINFIKKSFEENYGYELFIDFMNEFCKIESEEN